MNKKIKALILSAGFLLGGLATQSQAGEILLAGDVNTFLGSNSGNDLFYQNVFNGNSVANYVNWSMVTETGTTATETHYGQTASVTSAGLAGFDWAVFGVNRTSVSASELSALSSFVSTGGSLFLVGDGNPGFSPQNGAVNSVLDAIGSTMRLSTSSNYDNSGYTTLTGLVTTGPYTSGVTSWETAYASDILLGSGTALISGVADNGFGIGIGYEGVAVPEPTAISMLGLGILGLSMTRRRRFLQSK